MVEISNEVKKLFEEKEGPAFIATVDGGGKPNVVSKGSLKVLDDEHLWYIESAGKKTYENLKKNPHVAVALASQEKMGAYQLRGKAELVTEGRLYEQAVKRMEEISSKLGVSLPKPIAAIRIKVDEIYSILPGPMGGERFANMHAHVI